MATYNDAVLRNGTLGTDTDPLVPEPLVADLIKEATKQSAVLSQVRTVRMAAGTQRQPVLTTKPVAYWNAGTDTGLVQTSKAEWDNVQLVAEALDVIVPVPRDYLDDSLVDIWSEIRPELAEAVATKLDAACIFGTDAPTTFGDSIFEVADGVGNTVTAGTTDDLASDVASMGVLLAEQGYSLNGFMSKPGFNWQLVGLRSSDGVPIYQSSLSGGETSSLYGRALNEVANGAWSSSDAVLIAGDFSKAIVGIRQDIEFTVSTQAIIQDGSGAIVYNLFQQNMVALKLHVRYAFATANPVTALESDAASRAPFAVLAPAVVSS